MSEENIPFWLVWCPTGFAPKYRHTTIISPKAKLVSAEMEAARLARENPELEFYVLMPVTKAVKNDVLIERFVNAVFDELPF